jgi:hypothetical protein
MLGPPDHRAVSVWQDCPPTHLVCSRGNGARDVSAGPNPPNGGHESANWCWAGVASGSLNSWSRLTLAARLTLRATKGEPLGHGARQRFAQHGKRRLENSADAHRRGPPWTLEGEMIEALGMIEVALLTWAMGYLMLFPIGGGSRPT